MTRNRVYFVSDIHLGSPYHKEPKEVERRFVTWLRGLALDAKALYLVGDIFDYWFEYKYVVPRGYVRLLGAIADLVDKGVEVHFFTGNHDLWVRDYLETEVGVILHTAPYTAEIDGKQFFIAHGDEFDYRKKSFRLLRAIFHSKLCRVLYAAVHPRWTVGLAMRWSLQSRKKGVQLPGTEYQGEEREYLVEYAKNRILTEGVDAPHFFVFGHRHIMLDLMLSRQSRIIVLGDWINYDSYAVWDGECMVLATLKTEQ